MPYALETLQVLRIEKGHVTHNEINGTVVPADLGFGENGFGQQTGFRRQGDASAGGADRADRPHAGGGRAARSASSRSAAARTFSPRGRLPPSKTTRAMSPRAPILRHVGSTIALALVKNGRNRHGEEVLVWSGLHDNPRLHASAIRFLRPSRTTRAPCLNVRPTFPGRSAQADGRFADFRLSPLSEGTIIHVLARPGQETSCPSRRFTDRLAHALRPVSPDQWFIISDAPIRIRKWKSLFAALEPRATGVDQSHGRVRIRIEERWRTRAFESRRSTRPVRVPDRAVRG